MTQLYNNSIFWVETSKIKPNPYQPRKEFDPRALQDLADSIRQYGVLQPLVVTRAEIETESGLAVEYELIAGERRLRASKLAGLPQVPVIIRSNSEDAKVKLEIAIIENLQREDLNPIDRARAFMRLHGEFGFTHAEIGKKMGKSREYVSNSLRLLALPQDIMVALGERKISEGHTRPLMMLTDRPDEQTTLFKEIMIKKLSVRESEQMARRVAKEKARKKDFDHDPQIAGYEEKLAESLGTRVHIERRDIGGKIVIDYFSPDDLDTILSLLKSNQDQGKHAMLEKFMQQKEDEAKANVQESAVIAPSAVSAIPEIYQPELQAYVPSEQSVVTISNPELSAPEPINNDAEVLATAPSYLAADEPEMNEPAMLDDRSAEEVIVDENSDLYNINNFTI